MRTVLTGATGFIGSVLLSELLAAGHAVRALARSRDAGAVQGHQRSQAATDSTATHPHDAAPRTIDWRCGALPDPALADSLCAGQDAVIHCAGLAHVGASARQLREQNVDATLQLAAAARTAGVQHFIFLSSSKARYPAHSAYAQLKAEAEAALLALATPAFRVLCLRPSLVYGPGMRGNLAGLLRLLRRRSLPLFIASRQPLGLIGVSDVARAVVAALDCSSLPSSPYELSDGASYTLDEIVYHVRRQLSLPQPRWVVPRAALQGLAWVSTLLAPVTGTPFSMSTYHTLYDEAYRSDPAFAQLTGFQARDTFYTALPALLTSGARA